MTQIVGANLNDVDAWGGESVQLPPGPYQLRVKGADVEQKDKEGKITTQLVLDYEVVSGAMSGKTLKAWFSLDFSKDVPRKRLKSLVLACGVPIDPSGSFDTAALVGCKINADVVHETYDSKPDPITGGVSQKTAIRVVNERPFGAMGVDGAQRAASATVGGTSLPGLTRA